MKTGGAYNHPTTWGWVAGVPAAKPARIVLPGWAAGGQFSYMKNALLSPQRSMTQSTAEIAFAWKSFRTGVASQKTTENPSEMLPSFT